MTFENSPKGSRSIYTIEYPFVWGTSKDLEGSPVLLIKIGQIKVQSVNASDDMKSETEKKAQGSVQQGSNSTVSKDYSFEADRMLLDKKSGNPAIYTKVE